MDIDVQKSGREREGSLISLPCGVPIRVNFFPGTSLRSALKQEGHLSSLLIFHAFQIRGNILTLALDQEEVFPSPAQGFSAVRAVHQ
jgi:hypothetical protein